MNLFLIRHSDAEASSASTRDYERSLTPLGIDITRACVEKWKLFIPNFDYIFCSPFKRAYETARIIAEEYNCLDKLVVEEDFGCGSRTKDLVQIVNEYDGVNIAVVGHQPDLSYHVSDLISVDGCEVNFKKTAIAKINFRYKVNLRSGILEFLLPPSTLLE